MKRNLLKDTLFSLALFANVANAQSMQAWCDSLASNARDIYDDVTSMEYKTGQITYETTVNHYAGPHSQNSLAITLLQREILDVIVANKDKVSQQDVINYVYRRCPNDYARLNP